jgi:DNA-directed RNA polymerase subunit H
VVEFDVRKHALVPKHEILSAEQAKVVLDQFKITPHQLPLIKNSDPVATAIGAKPGDILKITRVSQTAGRAIAYRHVVEG